MRIASASTDRKLYFVAVDSTDLVTRKTGLTTFTVYRSVNGGSAVAYTTPTVTEISSANMPGCYALDLDEALTLNSARDTEEVCLHITCATMQPVTRTFELFRPETTEGQTLTVSSGTGDAAVQSIAASAITATSIASDAITAAKIADGAIDAATFAAGAINAAAIAADAITAAKVADGTIDAATFASGAITATAIATDAIGAAEIAAAGANKIADHIMRRTMANVRASSDGDTIAGTNGRSLLGVASKLKNKWSISAGTLTVCEENDSTTFFTEALTATNGADPITATDPA